MKLTKTILGQGYSCLIYFRDILDRNTGNLIVATMLLNGIGFIFMLIYLYIPFFDNPDYIEPVWFNTVYIQIVKLIHSSAIFLLIALGKSKGFNFLQRFALLSLVVMWVLNEYYLLTDDPRNIYFMYFCLVVYISFMVTALYKLTNRC